mmetsp:Transcript_123365/g.308162  ORF Transcript_123365/g.308162 Transcript_123365/m.308162 type:complete len:281 (-) Transcript_123365:981-1823(-)
MFCFGLVAQPPFLLLFPPFCLLSLFLSSLCCYLLLCFLPLPLQLLLFPLPQSLLLFCSFALSLALTSHAAALLLLLHCPPPGFLLLLPALRFEPALLFCGLDLCNGSLYTREFVICRPECCLCGLALVHLVLNQGPGPLHEEVPIRGLLLCIAHHCAPTSPERLRLRLAILPKLCACRELCELATPKMAGRGHDLLLQSRHQLRPITRVSTTYWRCVQPELQPDAALGDVQDLHTTRWNAERSRHPLDKEVAESRHILLYVCQVEAMDHQHASRCWWTHL